MKLSELDRGRFSGMHTLCVKTALTSNRPNVAVMLGIFVLSAPSNETGEGGIETVQLDDSFGVLQIENLTVRRWAELGP